MTFVLNALGKELQLSASPQNWIGNGQTTAYTVGTDKADAIWGNGSSMTLAGGSGDDTYYLYGSETVVETPGQGVDTIVAAWRDVYLPDNVENLTISGNFVGVGNSLDNIITGDASNQVLDGGAGDDVLTGGGGADVFVFDRASGHDLISDFDPASGSQIRLAGYPQFTTFAQVLAAMTQSGPDVILHLDQSDDITFQKTVISGFQAKNFQLGVDLSAMKSTFREDFNSLSLWNGHAGTWRTDFGLGLTSDSLGSRTIPTTGEKEIYVDPQMKGQGANALGLNPFSLSDGVLTISASQTPEADRSALYGYGAISGLLTTKSSFAQQYGYFDIRAELPATTGAWPTFWLLPAGGGWPPELDVLEAFGSNRVVQTAHWGATNTQSATSTLVSGATSGFHDYGMLWDAQHITWYIDGVEVGQIATPSQMNQPMYMLVNLAVTGDTDTAGFAASMKIDSINAYALPTGETDVYGADGALTKHFAGIAGQAYSDYDAIYAVNGAFVGDSYHMIAGSAGQTLTLSGGPGVNKAVFDQPMASYQITWSGENAVLAGSGRVFILNGVGTLEFSDARVDAPGAATSPDFSELSPDAKMQMITSLYTTYIGRDPTPTETSSWSQALTNGAFTLETMKAGLIGAEVKYQYDIYIGRDPTPTETSSWSQALTSGAFTIQTMEAGLIGAEVKYQYDTYIGRDPVLAEINAWSPALSSGAATIAQMKSVLIGAEIQIQYDTYIGRDPMPEEINAWSPALSSGAATIAQMKSILIGAEVKYQYDIYIGRDPTPTETSSWSQALTNGAFTLETMKAGLIGAEVKYQYDTYIGRDPVLAEINAWSPALSSGAATIAQMKSVLIGAEIQIQYDTYIGRDPMPEEINAWSPALSSGAATIAQMKSILIGAEVKYQYDIYIGRDPTPTETSSGSQALQNGTSLSDFHHYLVTTPEGQAQTSATVVSLYESWFGRDPLQSEASYWSGAVANGTSFDQIRDTLEHAPESGNAGVQHLYGTMGADTFNFANGWTRGVIDSFDAAQDTLALSASAYGRVNLLDSAHAREVSELDGSTDVLITLDPTHSVLLGHVHLASLQVSDFSFI